MKTIVQMQERMVETKQANDLKERNKERKKIKKKVNDLEKSLGRKDERKKIKNGFDKKEWFREKVWKERKKNVLEKNWFIEKENANT